MKIRKPSPRAQGFTLIELLTVIAIIAILGGILIPVIGSARRSMMKTEARSLYTVISNGIQGYQASYGYYPLGNSTYASMENTDDGRQIQVVAFKADDVDLVGLLMGTDRTLNPRGSSFTHFGDSSLNEDDEVIDPFGSNGFGIVFSSSGIIPAATIKGLRVRDPESGDMYYYDPGSDLKTKVFIYGIESVSKSNEKTVVKFVTYPKQENETTTQ